MGGFLLDFEMEKLPEKLIHNLGDPKPEANVANARGQIMFSTLQSDKVKMKNEK